MSYPAAGTSYAHDFSTPINTFPTPSQLLSSLNDHDANAHQRAIRTARREKRRKQKSAQLSKELGYTPTDPDLISSHDKKRYYLDCLEHYVLYLHAQLRLVGHEPVPIERVSSGRGLTSRSIRTIIVHLQKNASELNTQRRDAEAQYHSARASVLPLPPSLSRDPSSSSSSLDSSPGPYPEHESRPTLTSSDSSKTITPASPTLSSPLSSSSSHGHNDFQFPDSTPNFFHSVPMPIASQSSPHAFHQHYQPLHLSYSPDSDLSLNTATFDHLEDVKDLPLNVDFKLPLPGPHYDPLPLSLGNLPNLPPSLPSLSDLQVNNSTTTEYLISVDQQQFHSHTGTMAHPADFYPGNADHPSNRDANEDATRNHPSLALQRRHSIATTTSAYSTNTCPQLDPLSPHAIAIPQPDLRHPHPHPHHDYSNFNSTTPVTIIPPTLPHFKFSPNQAAEIGRWV